ncbi:MAG: hypothetical protein C0618_03355 [Desulfuromonas sp.]|nr:MAG: hypothetical protein C0618_03355 [Desulfuromonas sp.]
MAVTSVELKYGSERWSLSCDEAQLLTVDLPSAERPEVLVRRALANPVGTPPLAEICQPGDRVVIVTSDITRATGSALYLPILVDELNRAGVDDRDIEIVIALGIHRRQTADEHRRIVGALFGRIKVTDHDCDDAEQLVELGCTSGGIPVWINRTVAEADRVIVTGSIGFHYFAGFGGGRKGLVPGVASRQTCMASHFSVFNPPEIGGKHPRAVAGALQGNPVHQNLLEAAKMVHSDFLLNTVLSPSKDMLGVFCGDLVQAHLAGCELVRQSYEVPLEEPVDLAVVSCGGLPKDINFIQAQKALDYSVNAVRDGGVVILLAACPDGFGHPTFFNWFRYQQLDAFEAALRAGYQINGQTAYSVFSKARRFKVLLVSELSRDQTEAMGMKKAMDLSQAMEMARKYLPVRPEIVIIPEGGTVLPRVVRSELRR